MDVTTVRYSAIVVRLESYCLYMYNLSSTIVQGRLGAFEVRAVPFKRVGWGRNGRFFEGGEGPNSELVYTIRVYMISGRRGRGCRIFN